MKRLLLLGIVLLLLCAACQTPTRQARRMVARAEALAETMPDSTARLIDSVLHMPVYFNERRRMDIALLQGEALFRDAPLDDDLFEDTAYRVPTTPELERAADYYAQKKRYDRAAHAALYSGYVQQHYNEKENAMRSFKAAEQYGLLANDSLTVARAEYRMGKMLYYNGMEGEAINILETADLYLGQHFKDKAFVQNMIAISYIVLGRYDNAENCLKQSLNYAEKGNASKVRRKILNNYAVLYRLQGQLSQALYYLRQIAREFELNSAGKTLLYKNLGDVFVDMNEIDSAAYYYHLLEEVLPITQVKDETKISAYGALFRFAESRGNLPSALSYREKHEDCSFELMSRLEEHALFRIQQQYDYEALQNAMNHKIMHRRRIIAILCAVLTLFFMALATSQIQLAKAKKNEADIKASLLKFAQDNNELVAQSEEYKLQRQELEQRLNKARVKEQRVMQKLAVYLGHKKEPALLDSLKYSVMGNQDYWDAMMALFDMQFPGTRKELSRQHPNMTEKEQKILLLSYLDTSREDSALLLDTSVYMVDKLRNSVRKKMSKPLV